MLSNIGYAFAEVTPVPEIDRENHTVALNFVVKPGPRVTVRRIVFKGNASTADEVLRREMRQFESGWYSQAMIDRSKIRLQRTGFFETVEIETPEVAGTKDQVDVVVTVKERNAGSFVFGLGYSQNAGIVTSIQLSAEQLPGHRQPLHDRPAEQQLFQEHQLLLPGPLLHRQTASASATT